MKKKLWIIRRHCGTGSNHHHHHHHLPTILQPSTVKKNVPHEWIGVTLPAPNPESNRIPATERVLPRWLLAKAFFHMASKENNQRNLQKNQISCSFSTSGLGWPWPCKIFKETPRNWCISSSKDNSGMGACAMVLYTLSSSHSGTSSWENNHNQKKGQRFESLEIYIRFILFSPVGALGWKKNFLLPHSSLDLSIVLLLFLSTGIHLLS